MRLRKQYTSGFTLIELLVVIAIISLLVSILLPSLNRAKDLARIVTCASQERGIGLAMMVYAGDSGGHFPTATWRNPHIRPNLFFYDETHFQHSSVAALHRNDYVSFESFYCPSKKVLWWDQAIEEHLEMYNRPVDTYFYWGWEGIRGCGPPIRCGNSHPIFLTTSNLGSLREVSASSFALMGDVTLGWDSDNLWAWGAGWPSGPVDIFFTHHDSGEVRGSNILFGDAHVQWLDASKLEYGLGGNGQLWPIEADHNMLGGAYWEAYQGPRPFPCN